VDDLNFSFRAYSENDKIVVHVKMEGAEAVFRYTDTEAVSILAQNMGAILDYAVDDYTLSKKFKQQLNDELEDWLNDGP
jgi:hypothetical protein